ncbi:hypothetical protein [Streptomyces sp. NPDC089919]|uniref:imidazolonepropionase-like domain-containing protein n=1 Tax=Streptomyces sp. NPDC089919 TaxID=3155188 RepID=UPI0034265AD9
MRTLHAAPLVLPVGAAPVADGALLVEGDRIAAIGPRAELTAAHPTARIREWPGVLTPGLRQDAAAFLLRRCYFPDPREAEALGTAPLTAEATDALGADPARRAAGVRRGLQQFLRYGTTVLALSPDPLLSPPVAKVGFALTAPGSVTGSDPVALLDPLGGAASLASAVEAPLAVGDRADFAAFAVPDEESLLALGAGTCVATVLAGRLLYRGR